jgi:hypothetical protein
MDCVVADAVVVEPVSAPKFPANREINREFFDFGLARGSEVAICPMIHWTWSKIPYSTEQGILLSQEWATLLTRLGSARCSNFLRGYRGKMIAIKVGQ